MVIWMAQILGQTELVTKIQLISSYYNVSYAKKGALRISIGVSLNIGDINTWKCWSTRAWNYYSGIDCTFSRIAKRVRRDYAVLRIWLTMELCGWVYRDQYARWTKIGCAIVRSRGNYRNLSNDYRVYSTGFVRNGRAFIRNVKIKGKAEKRKVFCLDLEKITQ